MLAGDPFLIPKEGWVEAHWAWQDKAAPIIAKEIQRRMQENPPPSFLDVLKNNPPSADQAREMLSRLEGMPTPPDAEMHQNILNHLEGLASQNP